LHVNANQSNIKASETNIALEGVLSNILKKRGGGATKRASRLINIIPSTYTGEIFGFINFEQLNPMGELWQRLT
jgi:hypothetical protein